jgi:hypothetical protein
MYKEFFRQSNPGLLPEEICLEHPDFKEKLPSEMVDFYQELNGGLLRFDKQYVDVAGKALMNIEEISDIRRVKRFYSNLRREEAECFTSYYRGSSTIPYAHDLSDSLIPIAFEDFIYICIGYSNDREDKIYFLDLTPGFGPDEIKVIEVADSILSLLQQLKSFEEVSYLSQ